MKSLQILLPPVYLVICLLLMGLLDYLLPIIEFNHAITRYAGVLILITGLGLILVCARMFSKADTPIIPFEQSTSLITDGIFRYSRNPIYLGMIIILCGAALALGSLTPLLVIPVFYLVIQYGYIRHEEEFLERIFGDSYLQYCKRVRRWF